MKALLKKILRAAGYTIEKHPVYVPEGVDFCLDIKRLSGDTKITTVFDVGANQGQTTAVLCSAFPDARVSAFEPVKETFDQLVENTAALPNVRCFNFALGAEKCTQNIYVKRDSQCCSLVAPGELTPEDTVATRSVSVEAIDAFAKDHHIDIIDILKTDTEGFDLEVIRGAERHLDSRKIRFVFAEVTLRSNDSLHTSFFALTSYLQSKGYEFCSLYDYCRDNDTGVLYWCNALYMCPNPSL